MQIEASSSPLPAKLCPPWAEQRLAEIMKKEISLGNIPSTEAWQTRSLQELLAEHSERDDGFDPAEVDILFSQIVKRLYREGFNMDEIVKIVNARVGYRGGPPYCNREEVREAIHLKG